MRAIAVLEALILAGIDRAMTWTAPRAPAAARLRQARIVAHRGLYDNRSVFENTLAAFEAARAAGVWGLECDLRWTADLVPVVNHDPDCRRVFGCDLHIARHTFAELRRACPLVPRLDEVVAHFGGRLHLMIEVKSEAYPQPARQNAVLQTMWRHLSPGRDFHLLSLSLTMLDRVPAAPPEAKIPIARFNLPRLRRAAVRRGYGGICAHYILLDRRAIAAQHKAGRAVGTGFINSRQVFYRELHRGVDWIFSDRPAALASAQELS
jgi:glycerophosphoryl diester phosphodiesterase